MSATIEIISGAFFAIILLCIPLSIWSYLMGIKKLRDGHTLTIRKIGGTIHRVVAPFSEEYFINDPQSINYDPRYPRWYRIRKTLLGVDSTGQPIYGWANRGYEFLDRNEIPKRDWGIYVKEEKFLEKNFGCVSTGFYPFTGLIEWTYASETKHVQADEVRALITGDEKDHNGHPGFKIKWTSYDGKECIITKTTTSPYLPFEIFGEIACPSLDTGPSDETSDTTAPALPKKGAPRKGQMFNLTAFVYGKIDIVNTAQLLQIGPNLKLRAVTPVQAAVREFVASVSLDFIQSTEHNAAFSEFRKKLRIASYGLYDDRANTLTEGSEIQYGISFRKLEWKDIIPGDEVTSMMFTAKQAIARAEVEIAVRTKQGQARGAEEASYLAKLGEAKRAYLNLVNGTPPDPTLAKIYEELGKVHTLIFGNTGPTPPVIPTYSVNPENKKDEPAK